MRLVEKVLRELREKLVTLKQNLDEDVPNHGFDSALASAAEAGGVERAIAMVDERLKAVTPVKRSKFELKQPDLNVRRRSSK